MAGKVNIRGKEYTTVSQRVLDFRRVHPIGDGWGILTSIEHVDDTSVIMRAEVTRPDGRIVAVGYAEEHRASSQINKTSALENCETSAIGRALAAAGFGGDEYASANEVQRAIAQQAADSEDLKRWTDRQRAAFCAELGKLGYDYESVAAWLVSNGRPRPSTMPPEQRAMVLEYLRSGDRSAKIAAAVVPQ